MKIEDFTILTDNTRLVVNSSHITLQNPKIQGSVQSEQGEVTAITISVTAKIEDRDSLRELKGLINQTDF
ncbi:hypothetical protein ES705_37445 [subsurface metagenome]